METAVNDGHFFQFPPAALKAMTETRVDGNWLSPSGADSCQRQRWLKAEHPYHLDLEKHWTPSLGNAVHSWLEGDGEDHELFMGTTIEVPVGDEVVTVEMKGTIDKYEAEHKRITDYKTIKGWFRWNAEEGKQKKRKVPDDKHVLQINLYRLILEQNGYPVESAQIWYVVPSNIDSRKVVEVPLWDLQDTYYHAVELALPVAERILTGKLPEPYTEDHENYWLCRLCPVYKVCQQLHEKGK